jgi:hypothetical protein
VAHKARRGTKTHREEVDGGVGALVVIAVSADAPAETSRKIAINRSTQAKLTAGCAAQSRAKCTYHYG